MNPHCTVTERMKAVIIFKSSGTMQVPAFQSKGRQNDQSYVKNGFKETRPCFIRKTTGSVDQQYHIFDQSVQPDPNKLLKFHYYIIIKKKKPQQLPDHLLVLYDLSVGKEQKGNSLQ